MSKTWDTRLNQVVNSEWPAALFSGFNRTKIKKVLIKKVKEHYTSGDMQQLSETMSFGGTRIFKSRSVTELRNTKRLILLIHQVLGYHTLQETQMLKHNLASMDETLTAIIGRATITRALSFLVDRENWAREIPMRFGGRVVKYYSQGKDPRLGQIDMTENGWCLGMSVQWLAAKAAKLDFWGPHNSPEAAGSYRFVMAAQNMRTAKLGGSNVSDRAAFRLKRFGLRKSGQTTESANPSAWMLANNIVRSPSSYCRIGQSYVTGGGHAMAAYVDGGKVIFMDPNLGEYAFNSHVQFQQWFVLFARFMGYRFKRHYVEHYVSNQKPVDIGLADLMDKRRKAMGYA